MRTNAVAKNKMKIPTHGGGKGRIVNPASLQFERLVATCMLWEDTFYESGESIAKNIADICQKVAPQQISEMAIRARNEFKLRHVPLFLVAQLNKRRMEVPGLLADTVEAVVNRPDELSELLSIVQKVEGKKSLKKLLSHGLQKGLAKAFTKFNGYQLAKWNRDSEIKLRDVLFLTHPCPKDEDQATLWKQLVDGTLPVPDTWEVALSAGKDKKTSWSRLLEEKKLGAIALLMNLRNMQEAGVNKSLIKAALKNAKWDVVLPYRFISAAKAAPDLEDVLTDAMVNSLAGYEKLNGSTLLVVDISGSMGEGLSGKSQMNRIDAACGLAMLIREVCEDAVIYPTAGNDGTRIHATEKVPARHGFALRDAIIGMSRTLGGGGIFLKQCMDYIDKKEKRKFDRVIVFTDEQDCDIQSERSPIMSKMLGKHNYIMNVAGCKPGLDVVGTWERINGFSERSIDYIRWNESFVQ